MNERVEKLAELCGFRPSPSIYDRNQSFDIEKFAKLIVKECASICEINGASYKHSFTPSKAKLAESTSVYCGALIKKHFGVEE